MCLTLLMSEVFYLYFRRELLVFIPPGARIPMNSNPPHLLVFFLYLINNKQGL